MSLFQKCNPWSREISFILQEPCRTGGYCTQEFSNIAKECYADWVGIDDASIGILKKGLNCTGETLDFLGHISLIDENNEDCPFVVTRTSDEMKYFFHDIQNNCWFSVKKTQCKGVDGFFDKYPNADERTISAWVQFILDIDGSCHVENFMESYFEHDYDKFWCCLLRFDLLDNFISALETQKKQFDVKNAKLNSDDELYILKCHCQYSRIIYRIKEIKNICK